MRVEQSAVTTARAGDREMHFGKVGPVESFECVLRQASEYCRQRAARGIGSDLKRADVFQTVVSDNTFKPNLRGIGGCRK